MRLLLLAPLLVSSTFAQIHPDAVLARMVPPGTVSLLGARMDRIESTPLYTKLIAQQKLPDLERFARETGFDPRRDVREMLLASNGTEGKSVALARGTFHIQDFKDLHSFKHGIYVIHGNDQSGFCLLDATTAAAGPLPGLYAALDHWHAGLPPATPSLLKRAEQIPASSQVWAVSEGGFNIPLGINMRQGGTDFANIFRGVETSAFWADLQNGIDATLEGDVKTEEDAKNLADAARGVIGFGRLSVPEDHRDLLKLWDGFHVDQQGRHITLKIKAPQNLIDQLISLLQSGGIGPGHRSGR